MPDHPEMARQHYEMVSRQIFYCAGEQFLIIYIGKVEANSTEENGGCRI